MFRPNFGTVLATSTEQMFGYNDGTIIFSVILWNGRYFIVISIIFTLRLKRLFLGLRGKAIAICGRTEDTA